MEYGAEFLYNTDIKPTVKVSRGKDREPVYLQAVGAYEAEFMRRLTDCINDHMNLAEGL
jgi:hypothetical protein